jgi:eukaryotic-like serine/threonine-protein kinase
VLPDDPQLKQVWLNLTIGTAIQSEPSGADVAVKKPIRNGCSMGAYNGVILSALHPRVKASVLVGGGMERGTMLPEYDIVNFAPRVKQPTLMINGRNDFSYPVESAQLPLFRLLGTPEDQKRHALFEGGHLPVHVNDVIREILDWFDCYLGTVDAPPRR